MSCSVLCHHRQVVIRISWTPHRQLRGLPENDRIIIAHDLLTLVQRHGLNYRTTTCYKPFFCNRTSSPQFNSFNIILVTEFTIMSTLMIILRTSFHAQPRKIYKVFHQYHQHRHHRQLTKEYSTHSYKIHTTEV